ncbi:transposase family protein [Rohdeia mirabilis]|uniref:transposase family protein n=1 Tax=Rohdeia mirabilis TaxID=2528008 RepID=UPI003AF3856C
MPYPECGKECRTHDRRERKWRHLDTCDYRTVIVAQVARVRCPEHGVRQVTVSSDELIDDEPTAAAHGEAALVHSEYDVAELEPTLSELGPTFPPTWSTPTRSRARSCSGATATRSNAPTEAAGGSYGWSPGQLRFIWGPSVVQRPM